ncbi:MAG: alpha-galactosidase [Kosmotoga sp.]|nr:alpha-galactosidase [Kosmotoga sp.]
MRVQIPGMIDFEIDGQLKTKVVSAGLEFNYKLNILDSGYLINLSLTNIETVPIKLSSFTVAKFADLDFPFYFNNWGSWYPFRLYERIPDTKQVIAFAQSTKTTLFSATPIPELFNIDIFPSDYFIANKGFLAGFLDSKVSHPYFTIDEATKTVEARIELFGKPLQPGETIEIEPLVVFHSDKLNRMLENYAEKIKDYKKPVFKEFEGIGWCSWYHYFTDITFEELKKNVELLANLREERGLPYTLVQLDDGYQKDIGDWLVTNEKFPSLEEIANEISGKGFIPGLWLAPFCASETSDLFKEHPEWFVKDSSGNPKRAFRNWEKNIYALDLSNKEVLDFLKDLMTKTKKAGFRYIKIDFLFAGAIPGIRQDKDITPIEAYVKGLETIRKALGDDVYLLGCGAPLLPSIGYVDAMRIGPDTAPIWGGELPDLGIPSAKYSIRNALTRYFMHKRLWINDPDTPILRSQAVKLSDNEKELFSYVCGLLDNPIIESDDMSLVDDNGIEILNRTSSLMGGRPRVYFDDTGEIFTVAVKGGKEKNSVAIINLSDEKAKVKIPEEALSWSGVSVGKMEVEVEPRSIFLKSVPSVAVELKKTVEYKDDERQVNYYEEA